MVTSSQLARFFGVSKSTVNRLAKEGRIPHVQLPSGHRRFDPDAVLLWLESEARQKINTDANANAH